MLDYDVRIDGTRATPEQVQRRPNRAMLRTSVYGELEKLGYRVDGDRVWGDPLGVEPEISEQHKRTVEENLGIPLAFSRVSRKSFRDYDKL